MRAWRRAFVRHFESDALLCRPFSLLLRKNRPSNEFTFVERDEEAKPRFDRRSAFVQFMPIERVTNLGPQCIPRPKPSRLRAKGMTIREDERPYWFNHRGG